MYNDDKGKNDGNKRKKDDDSEKKDGKGKKKDDDEDKSKRAKCWIWVFHCDLKLLPFHLSLFFLFFLY